MVLLSVLTSCVFLAVIIDEISACDETEILNKLMTIGHVLWKEIPCVLYFHRQNRLNVQMTG